MSQNGSVDFGKCPPDFEDASEEPTYKTITKEVVEKTLLKDKGPGAKLLSWRTKDFTKKGDNYMCVVTSLQVKFLLDGEESEAFYVIKVSPDQVAKLFQSFIDRAFTKECNVYEKLLPDLNKIVRLQTVECITIEQTPGHQALVMQDLRRRGFRMYDRKKGLDVHHARLVLRELARLHAASIILQRDRGGKDLYEIYPFLEDDFLKVEDDRREQQKYMISNEMDRAKMLASKVEGYSHAEDYIRDLQSRAMDLMTQQLEVPPGGVAVLNHGDCWNNNFMFRYEGDEPVEVMLLDLQIARKGSPALDLNYMFFTSLNGPVRRKNLDDFLRLYHESFEEVLENHKMEMPFTLEELHQEYKDHNLFGFLSGCMLIPMVIAEVEDIPDFRKVSDENMGEFLEESKDRFLKMTEKNPFLRPRFLDMFDELIPA